MYQDMTIRAVSRCAIVRSANPPMCIACIPCCRCFRTRRVSLPSTLKLSHPQVPCSFLTLYFHGDHFTSHSLGLINCVLEELKATRPMRRIRGFKDLELVSTAEFVGPKNPKKTLQEGCLLVFQKDTQKLLLAVAQKPDGKKNWIVCDQNGVNSSIKPKQVTYIIAVFESFDHRDISDFIQKAQCLLDPAILVCAWEELLENKRSVTPEELAEIIYGNREPLESYCAYILLSQDDIYFNQLESKGYLPVYEPRPTVQVEENVHRKKLKESSNKEVEAFAKLLVSARVLPHYSKPSKCSWLNDEKLRRWITSLEAYAFDACKNDEQKKIAGNILKGMGLSKTSSAAVNLLIDIGYFPVHVNLDLLKLKISTDESEEVIFAAEDLLTTTDVDEGIRKDLTSLKVYAIDINEADELDDALSAMKLPDGKINVWIHVADPACLVEPQSIIDRDAMRRGTSIYLPTATFPMFPEKLAMECMSLRQGKLCKAVSVSVTLHPDGSILEYTIYNSIIRPTYMLTYQSASELLHLNLEEEAELRILSEAASLRFKWRCSQGAIDMNMIKPRVKVVNPDDPEPTINLYAEDQSNPAMRLVSELMILCGEVIATFGSVHNIPLPYRRHSQSNISAFAFAHLPEGPVRSSAYVRIMRAAEMDFKKPIPHDVLGIPGYVQFTSPIRRYVDLLAHYQIKSFLRGESLPFSSGELEGMQCLVNMNVKSIKKLESRSLRYWLLEYFRRQPREMRFGALILWFIKDRNASLLLVEVGIQVNALVSLGKQVGDEIEVVIEEVHPREDVLSVREV